MTKPSTQRGKAKLLTRYEKALLCIAYHLNRNALTDHDVEMEILDILGLVFVPTTKAKKRS